MALKLDPAFGDAYAVPAYFYVITRRYHEAIALYQQAVRAQPDLWAARVELANCLLRENRIEEARTFLRDGIEAARAQGNAHAAGEMAEFLASLGALG